MSDLMLNPSKPRRNVGLACFQFKSIVFNKFANKNNIHKITDNPNTTRLFGFFPQPNTYCLLLTLGFDCPLGLVQK